MNPAPLASQALLACASSIHPEPALDGAAFFDCASSVGCVSFVRLVWFVALGVAVVEVGATSTVRAGGSFDDAPPHAATTMTTTKRRAARTVGG